MKDKIFSFLNKKESYYEPDKNNSDDNKKEEINKKGKEDAIYFKNVLEKFKTRRSIRKLSNRPVDWKVIYDIIDAALNAPAAGNVQNTYVIVVEDKKTKDELGKLETQQYWLCDAPYILIVVREKKRLQELYPELGLKYSIQNSAAVIENILMLAHFKNLGACWVQSSDSEVVKDALGVPHEFHEIDAVIPIGYPLESPFVDKHPTSARLFFENFGNLKRH